jgi:hypothetical protein
MGDAMPSASHPTSIQTNDALPVENALSIQVSEDWRESIAESQMSIGWPFLVVPRALGLRGVLATLAGQFKPSLKQGFRAVRRNDWLSARKQALVSTWAAFCLPGWTLAPSVCWTRGLSQ